MLFLSQLSLSQSVQVSTWDVDFYFSNFKFASHLFPSWLIFLQFEHAQGGAKNFWRWRVFPGARTNDHIYQAPLLCSRNKVLPQNRSWQIHPQRCKVRNGVGVRASLLWDDFILYKSSCKTADSRNLVSERIHLS